MNKNIKKPKIHQIETITKSKLFTFESVSLEFCNGEKRIYERMKPSDREAVMIVPLIKDHLILIREYGVGNEEYELGFPKGLMNYKESIAEAANRELKEEVGFGSHDVVFLTKLSMTPSYFSSKTNIVIAKKLYPEQLQGDEPEPLPIIYWPVSKILCLVNEPDFCEARNVSAVFLAHAWLNKT